MTLTAVMLLTKLNIVKLLNLVDTHYSSRFCM